MNPSLDKTRDAVRRHGVGGVARRAARYAHSEARLRLWHDEHHVMYATALGGDRPRLELPSGFRLVEGDGSHIRHLPTIPATGMLAAHAFLERGGRLFLVFDADEQAAFAGWGFHGELPLSVSPRGLLPIPDAFAGMEECYTADRFRGRGIAPAAVSLISDRLEAEGDSTLVVAAMATAEPLRRALTKAGMQTVGDVYTRRRLDVARMRFAPTAEVGRRLAAQWASELAN